MDFNPYDPVERGEALRDEVIGLRTTPERGFFSSEWDIENTESATFPSKNRTILDYLSFRYRNYKSPQQSPEEYITGLLSAPHFLCTTIKDQTHVRVVRGRISLNFLIDSFNKDTSDVMLDNSLPTKATKAVYSLCYDGFSLANEWHKQSIKEMKEEITKISPPNLIHFTDTGNEWEEFANAFSNHYERQ